MQNTYAPINIFEQKYLGEISFCIIFVAIKKLTINRQDYFM